MELLYLINMDKLTPQLTIDQLKQNIDALQKGGLDNAKVQAYVDNYQKNADGTYGLKNLPKSPLQGVADVVNKPGVLNSASQAFQHTAKLVGGAGLNIGQAISASSPSVHGMQKSLENLTQIDLQAVQKAREIRATNPVQAKKLLDIVNSHGNSITLNDLPSIDTQQNNAEQIAGAGLGSVAEIGGLMAGGAGATEAIGAKTFGQGVLRGVYQGAGVGADYGALQGLSSAMEQNKGTGDVLKAGGSGAVSGGVVGGITGGFFGGLANISKLVDKFKGIFSPKKLEDVLSTAEADIHKLNPSERKVWFEAKQQQITSQSEATTQQIKQNLLKTAEKHAQDAETLKHLLDVTSRDKVIELRPKIVQAMGEQSKTYRSLVDEAMAGKENVPIKTEELKSFIDSRFAEDPGKAAQIKLKLGLTEQVNPLSTKSFGNNVPTKLKSKTTLGEIYAQTKSLKQDLNAGKVFSSDDKLTDDAIHTLSSYMKNNGIDLKEANQFWAKYAPVRDELVMKANPFNLAGTKTKGLADTLSRVAQGKDVNSENFIKESEKLLGTSMTKEAKAVVKRLVSSEKKALADKLNAQIRLEENKMATDRALQKLSNAEYEVERKARVRAIIKKVLGYGLASAVGSEIANKVRTGL